jgi:hypothetical protein
MRKIFAVCAIALGIGCSDSTAPAASVAGVWTLQSLNGYSVPFVSQQSGGDLIELTSDVITADASGSFTQMTVMKYTSNGQVTIDSIPDSGTFAMTVDGPRFAFNSGSPPATGVIDGDTMTVRTDIVLIYKR